jgi:hypothetical protein
MCSHVCRLRRPDLGQPDPVAVRPNAEASQRGIWFGAGTADGPAFPLHAEAARRYFAQAGSSSSGFVAR